MFLKIPGNAVNISVPLKSRHIVNVINNIYLQNISAMMEFLDNYCKIILL